MTNKIQLGMKVCDRISGFEGIVVTIADHITGCRRIGAMPVERADRGDEEFFYPAQLEISSKETEFSTVAENAITNVDFVLGDELEDEVTGVSGIVSTISYQLYNCPRVAIQPVDNSDSKEVPDRAWFDAPRMSRIGDGISAEFEEQVNTETTAATGASDEDVRRKHDKA